MPSKTDNIRTRISSRQRESYVTGQDEDTRSSRRSDHNQSNLSGWKSRHVRLNHMKSETTSRRGRAADSNDTDKYNKIGSRDSDATENRGYREHRSELSQRSRRDSYRRPDYLAVRDEEDITGVWRGDGDKPDDNNVQW